MLQNLRKSKAGFTLIELAIVLAIAGLLFAGLWRLMSGGNQQLRDQAAASSQSQLISASKTYLASSEGSTTFMAPMNPNATKQLKLPSTQAAAAGTAGCVTDPNMAGNPGFCSILPAGTWVGTVNSYGQSYQIMVLKDNSAAGTAPSTYSFMIVTTGGDVIPDTSGGRITAMIGGDGGFVYSSNVCGAPINLTACGAYGAWSVATSSYGLNAGYSGSVASRTYYAPEQSSTNIWLARLPDPGGAPFALNTMSTPLYLGGQTLDMGSYNAVMLPTGGGILNLQGATVNMSYNGTATGGGAFNLAAGTINMQGGGIVGSNDTSNISLTHTVGTAANPLVTLSTNCSSLTTAGCPAAVNVSTGDINMPNGELNANTLFAQTFIYQTSDARLKTNIQPLRGGLDDIMKLKPVSFAFKANGKESLGVIAQDLEKVYPQLVGENQQTKFVNYDGLIAPLIAAVQELKSENDQLRQQLKEESAREDRLERKLKNP